jgi:hypothetical protein
LKQWPCGKLRRNWGSQRGARGCNVRGRNRASGTEVTAAAPEMRSTTRPACHRGRRRTNQKNGCDANMVWLHQQKEYAAKNSLATSSIGYVRILSTAPHASSADAGGWDRVREAPKIEDEAPPLYQPLTAPTGVGLLGVSAPRRGSSRSSSAWLGRSQKDGLPPAAEELTSGSRPSTRA